MPDDAAPVVAPPVTEPVAATPPAAPVTPPADATPAPKAETAPVTETPPAAVELKLEPVAGFPESEQARVLALAKDMGMDQAAAQKLLEREVATFKSEVEAFTRERAAKETEAIAINKSHPTYGGTKYEETNQRINQALAWLGDEGKALAALLDEEGARHAPAIHNALAKIGYSMADGKFIQGTAPQPDPNRPATLAEMYPSMK
jgi:hypothetical protein